MSSSIPRIITGQLSLNSKGKGFIKLPDVEEDIVIMPEHIGIALSGDTVEAETFSGFRGATEAKITRIVERKKVAFVGTLVEDEQDEQSLFLEPDDHRAHITIWLRDAVKAGATGGMKAMAGVDFDRWTDGRIMEGTLLKLIGHKGENNTEMEAIVLERGFDVTFPEEVVKNAEEVNASERVISTEEISKRRDMRGVFTCTIDPFDAKDFDDALSLQWITEGEHAGSVEIGVHIADVSHFVRTGTDLDKEARKRATSVYLVDRTVPMLPSVLSTDLCSLNPHEDRLAFSAIFIIKPDGTVIDRWFGRSVIYSDQRFTYENAQELLTLAEKSGVDAVPKDMLGAAAASSLVELNRLAKIFLKERREKGTIDFDSTEIKFKLDESGKPIAIIKKERMDTHRLVEEFMLLANREVAEYMFKNNKEANKHLAGVYRIHDFPNQEKLHELGIFVRALGFDFNPGKEIKPKEVQKLLNDVVGTGAEAMIKTATLRSMAKAIYSTKNVGHFGLAFEYYTHFTSPIRRYPDLMVHRIMAELLAGKKLSPPMIASLEKICFDSSKREVEAADAERASVKYKQVEYMSEHVGEVFDAVISGIADWGMYVEHPDTKAEGLIRLKDLPGDFYSVNQKTYTITGEKTKREFKLGDAIKVKLMRADLENRMLDFALTE